MTTDGAPGDGPVEPRTIPMPRSAPDDVRDDDTQQLPPVRDDADGLPGPAADADGLAVRRVVPVDEGSDLASVGEATDVVPVDRAQDALSVDRAPDTLSVDRAPDTLSVDRAPDTLSVDEAPEPLTVERATDGPPVDQDPGDAGPAGAADVAPDPPPDGMRPQRPFLPSAPVAQVTGADVPRVYADGSALSRYLAGAPAREAWLAWAGQHESELVTTPLGLTELRRIAQPRGMEARGMAVDVSGRIEVARFSDQTLRKASKVSAVLPPFVALHLGAALAHPGVTAIATYDRQLAQVAALYGLSVVTPGWPDRWWERDA